MVERSREEVNGRDLSLSLLTFLMVAVYWASMLWSIPSICLTRSHTVSVFMELRRMAGVPDTTEAEP